MFKPSYSSHNTRSKMTLDTPLRNTNTGQQALSFFGPKIWIKTSHSAKNVRTRNFKQTVLVNRLNFEQFRLFIHCLFLMLFTFLLTFFRIYLQGGT